MPFISASGTASGSVLFMTVGATIFLPSYLAKEEKYSLLVLDGTKTTNKQIYMYVPTCDVHRCPRDNWREKERVRELRRTVYDAVGAESNAPLLFPPFGSTGRMRLSASAYVCAGLSAKRNDR